MATVDFSRAEGRSWRRQGVPAGRADRLALIRLNHARLTSYDGLEVGGVIWIARSLVFRKRRIRIDRTSKRYMCFRVERKSQKMRSHVTGIRNMRSNHYIGGFAVLEAAVSLGLDRKRRGMTDCAWARSEGTDCVGGPYASEG